MCGSIVSAAPLGHVVLSTADGRIADHPVIDSEIPPRPPLSLGAREDLMIRCDDFQ